MTGVKFAGLLAIFLVAILLVLICVACGIAKIKQICGKLVAGITAVTCILALVVLVTLSGLFAKGIDDKTVDCSTYNSLDEDSKEYEEIKAYYENSETLYDTATIQFKIYPIFKINKEIVYNKNTIAIDYTGTIPVSYVNGETVVEVEGLFIPISKLPIEVVENLNTSSQFNIKLVYNQNNTAEYNLISATLIE